MSRRCHRYIFNDSIPVHQLVPLKLSKENQAETDFVNIEGVPAPVVAEINSLAW